MANIGIKPRNATEVQIIDITRRAHNWLAKELDIDSTLEFGRTAYWGRDAFHAGLWYNHTKQSVLNFRNLYGENVMTLLRIIGHEARHAVQYRDGMLSTLGRHTYTHNERYESGMWNGERYYGPYLTAPWEIDARAHEEQYAQLITDSGILTEDELFMTIPGLKDDIYLEDETRQKVNDEFGPVSWYKATVQTEQENDMNYEKFIATIQEAGWEMPKGKKKWTLKDGYDWKTAKSVWDKAKKLTKTTYRKDAIAFLTREQERTIPKDKRFWAAQANVVEFEKRALTLADMKF